MTDEEMERLEAKGVSMDEICKMSGRTPSAVASRIKRARNAQIEARRSVFDETFNQIFCKKLGA